jgi:fused signal recognition particle receptor
MTGKPIIYLGTGQGYGDIEEFNPEWFVGKVFE